MSCRLDSHLAAHYQNMYFSTAEALQWVSAVLLNEGKDSLDYFPLHPLASLRILSVTLRVPCSHPGTLSLS